MLVVLPAELHAGAAVFIIGLQDEIFAMLAHVFKEAEGFTIARGIAVGEEARPGNVPADQFALGGTEECGVLLVGEDGEKGFLVRNFAAERIGNANRAGSVGFDESGALGGARDNVVDQDAAVDEIHALAVNGKFAGFENQVARIGYDCGDSVLLKMPSNDFEFAPGGDFAPIHDGDY